MKQKFISLAFAGLAYSFGFTQPVIQNQKTIGGSNYDELHSSCVTKDGGLIIAGISYSNKSGEKTQNTRGGSDYWIVKMNRAGKIEWDKTIGGNGDDYCKDVIQTSDGGYAVVGESLSNISVEKSEDSRGFGDYWLVKLDSAGNIQWDKTIGGNNTELIDNLVQTDDGGYILAGSSNSDISGEKTDYCRGNLDIWVVKLDKRGNKVWDKTIGGDNYDLASGVLITNDGGLAIAGFSGSGKSGEKSEENRGVQSDYWIIKLDKKGNIQWDKTIGGAVDDYARGIQQTEDGGYMIAGASNSYLSGEKTDNSRGGYDYWVVKLDSKGQVIWDKTIGGNADDSEVWCLEKTSDGGFIFGGKSSSDISGEKTESSRGGFDYWVVKLDESGQVQWDKTLGGFGEDNMLSINEARPNYYVVGGFSWSDISGDKTGQTRGLADYWVVLLHDQEVAGTTSASTINNVKTSFLAYPNPAKDKLNIKVDGKAVVSLSDQSGKIILTKTIENNAVINLSALAAGLYFVKNNTTGRTQKIAVIK
jgi:hypothetical protein